MIDKSFKSLKELTKSEQGHVSRHEFQFMQMKHATSPSRRKNARPPSDTTTGASHSTPSPVKPISQHWLLRICFPQQYHVDFFLSA